MFCRLAATIFAGALVLVPPVRAGLDVGQPGEHQSAIKHRGGQPGLQEKQNSTAWDDGENDGGNDTLAADVDVAAFGFGAKTGFQPSEEPRELVLSFDDGPDLKFTPLVLDELDRRGLKAIFFVTGQRVIGDRAEDVARRELLGRIAAHGHMVANHTMTHQNLCREGADTAAEIDENTEVITQATGVRPLLFRAPYGARCKKLEIALTDRQLVSVGWNLDPQDWKNPTSDGILTYLQTRLSKLRGRGILLLHDTHPASVFALGPLLDWIARENRLAVRAGRPPIVLRDYSVFLPPRAVPPTGMATVAQSLFGSMVATVTTGLAPATAVRSLLARR